MRGIESFSHLSSTPSCMEVSSHLLKATWVNKRGSVQKCFSHCCWKIADALSLWVTHTSYTWWMMSCSAWVCTPTRHMFLLLKSVLVHCHTPQFVIHYRKLRQLCTPHTLLKKTALFLLCCCCCFSNSMNINVAHILLISTQMLYRWEISLGILPSFWYCDM